MCFRFRGTRVWSALAFRNFRQIKKAKSNCRSHRYLQLDLAFPVIRESSSLSLSLYHILYTASLHSTV